jgi:phosphorylcholine metabolism protein LicD
LTWGSLIAQHRCNDLMWNDDDIDLMVSDSDYLKLKKIMDLETPGFFDIKMIYGPKCYGGKNDIWNVSEFY